MPRKATLKRKHTNSKSTDSKVAQLSLESLELVANFFKVLSEPSRLQIVCVLKSGPHNVTEIIEETGLGQANVSKHLKLLAQAGIVSREPRGVSAYYQIANQSFFQLCEIVCETLSIQLNEQNKQIEELAAASPSS
ncbi:transcriptional regulator, ArsR family protein [Synechococcus sp. PCC 7335]|uniref:ArsR/SmtB family transcription factor n=1 Tax=Synechococcus sp. (strain ATCC 29403 / PCC 7335) TaxID=91464 RepID=UPI00017EB905|nr:metalloregulator ArsR/SmtB family transcription factor [Synechococcus sp. PCC 7335]EDX83290.1 transcriptional regulator, ArsR family protein [Synechococcus sp. PCC 7335]